MPPEVSVAAKDRRVPGYRRALGWAIAEVALIVGVFFVHAGWPVPDVNEAHYLAKARHYWDPAWLEGDFFLASADAHLVFYWLFGWLTLLVPLPAFAWIGRLVAWVLLACGWRALSRAIVAQPLVCVVSAALFVAAGEHLHMSGEWVVGGLEAKGPAYALVFFGLAHLVHNRWNAALACLGAATALHVLVGGWTLVAAAGAWLSLHDAPPLRRMLPGVLAAVVIALPGVLPAVALTRGVEPQRARQANEIYVFQRLAHHLNPIPTGQPHDAPAIRPIFQARHAALAIGWLLLYAALPSSASVRRLARVVLAAVAIALVGYLAAAALHEYRALAAAVLRFYWFRLSDALLPAGAALCGCAAWPLLVRHRPALATLLLAGALAAVSLHLGHVVWQRVEHPWPRDVAANGQQFQQWLEICAQVRQLTPADARFIVPRWAATFRWYAERSCIGTWKDVPQDAAHIVAWWQRMADLAAVGLAGSAAAPQARPEEALRQLGRKYQATYVLVPPGWRSGRTLHLPLVYDGGPAGWAIYRLDRVQPGQ